MPTPLWTAPGNRDEVGEIIRVGLASLATVIPSGVALTLVQRGDGAS